ncbi:MAG: hypothetical protein WCJ88_12215 [Actinomycetes bacterium]
MRNQRARHDRHRAERFGTIDAAGRFSLGRVDRSLGPDLRFAGVIATKSRLIVRFLDTPDPPEGWELVPVVRQAGRYPHLRLTGLAIRSELRKVGLDYPVCVQFVTSLESRQVVMRRIR